MELFEQLSFFTAEVVDSVRAVCLMDNRETYATQPEDWMTRLVEDGQYVVDVCGHSLVLRPVQARADSIHPSHRFYHYLIGGQVFSGIFVGGEAGV